jgi:SAM-dependent methyltransferase
VLDLQVLNTDNFSVMNSFFALSEKFWKSSYLPEKPNGTELENRFFNVDLQNMTFENNMFDVVLTSDVMEHVRHSEQAHREIFRVLKTGGIYIFTVPYNPELEQTRILVDTSTDEDVFLCRPQYHGDPLTGGILVYRIFGKSLLAELNNIGFFANNICVNSEKHLVLNGDVFCAFKPDVKNV